MAKVDSPCPSAYGLKTPAIPSYSPTPSSIGGISDTSLYNPIAPIKSTHHGVARKRLACLDTYEAERVRLESECTRLKSEQMAVEAKLSQLRMMHERAMRHFDLEEKDNDVEQMAFVDRARVTPVSQMYRVDERLLQPQTIDLTEDNYRDGTKVEPLEDKLIEITESSTTIASQPLLSRTPTPGTHIGSIAPASISTILESQNQSVHDRKKSKLAPAHDNRCAPCQSRPNVRRDDALKPPKKPRHTPGNRHGKAVATLKPRDYLGRFVPPARGSRAVRAGTPTLLADAVPSDIMPPTAHRRRHRPGTYSESIHPISKDEELWLKQDFFTGIVKNLGKQAFLRTGIHDKQVILDQAYILARQSKTSDGFFNRLQECLADHNVVMNNDDDIRFARHDRDEDPEELVAESDEDVKLCASWFAEMQRRFDKFFRAILEEPDRSERQIILHESVV